MTGERRFRKDIEGLRAVSIVSVVLYHVQAPGFSGGFIGVDIFFVISGFLISGLLLDEAAATQRIDLVRFWSRRARRLLPNASLTLLATLALATVIFPTHTRDLLAKEVAAAALYVSNYYFAANAVDYFRAEDALSPVMHFWSLSIEEQFYLVWPVALLVAYRTSRGPALVAPMLCAVWLLSFAACVSLVRESQPLAFFHTETRCWQLATGALAAWWLRRGGALPPVIGWAGLAGIAGGIAGLDDAMTYPGMLALLPTLCAAAVLAARPTNGWSSPERLLALPLLQWLGARSYSWYLWHWPVIVFAAALFPASPLAALLALPVSLAIASIVFSRFEDPIRRGRTWPSPPGRSLAGGAAAIAAVLVGSAAFARMPVLGGASAELIAALKRAAKDHGPNYADKCHRGYDDTTQPACSYGNRAGAHRVVLFGDSHAAQWFAPVDAAAKAAGWRFDTWTKTSCPSADVTVWYRPRRAPYVACDDWRAAVLAQLTGRQRPDLVLISNFEGYDALVARDTGRVEFGAEAEILWDAGLRAVLDRLVEAGIAVVIIRDTPRASKTFAKCLAAGGGAQCDRPRAQAVTDGAAHASPTGPGIEVLDLTDRICGPKACPVLKDNMVVYSDYHHLTSSFAATLRSDFDLLLRRYSK